VDFPIKNGEYFHSYVSLPEGTMLITLWLSNIAMEHGPFIDVV
jgi:hypothetical protein